MIRLPTYWALQATLKKPFLKPLANGNKKASALLFWKLSGEVFSETKFLRLVLASFALALGFNISGTPLANLAVNPFASALAGLLFSKGLNYIKEVPTQLLSQVEHCYWSVKTNICFRSDTCTAISNFASFSSCDTYWILSAKLFLFLFLFFDI